MICYTLLWWNDDVSLVLFYEAQISESLLDNAPIYRDGCVIQKRLQMKVNSWGKNRDCWNSLAKTWQYKAQIFCYNPLLMALCSGELNAFLWYSTITSIELTFATKWYYTLCFNFKKKICKMSTDVFFGHF